MRQAVVARLGLVGSLAAVAHMPEVVVVGTGTANLASVRAAFARQGAATRLANQAADVLDATHAMLPGVGAFGAAMAGLEAAGLGDALRDRIAAGRPTMAICVGHQLLFQHSAESPGVAGLGIVAANVDAFEGPVRVPQFGWNTVQAPAGSALFEDGHAYFANSFRAVTAPGFEVALSRHGGPFVAAMARGTLLATQFHPELSGAYGAALLARFLDLR